MKKKLSLLLLSTSLLACSGMALAAAPSENYTTNITVKNHTGQPVTVYTTLSPQLMSMITLNGSNDMQTFALTRSGSFSTATLNLASVDSVGYALTGNLKVCVQSSTGGPACATFPLYAEGNGTDGYSEVFINNNPSATSSGQYTISATQNSKTAGTVEINSPLSK